MNELAPSADRRRDMAARAAWLYYAAGRTQDEIAESFGLSRQAVQRLVALAVAEKLIRFRLDHPIAACMELAEALCARHGLEFCEVSPSDPREPGAIAGVAAAAAERIERLVATRAPLVLCVGTGRTLRAAVEELAPLERPQHKIASLVGSMSSGGPASPYDVVMRLADRLGAERYPLPAPLLADSAADREALQGLRAFRVLEALRMQATATIVGISEIGWRSPMHRDGFLTDEDIAELARLGAVGEVCGWAFDAEGRIVVSSVAERVTSLALETPPRRSTIVVGGGPAKVEPLRAALRGRLVTALVTDEATAASLVGT